MRRDVMMKWALLLVQAEKRRELQHQEDLLKHGWSDYCQHDRYVGPPGGYDYLCGECEDGVTVYQLALASARDYLTRCRGWDFTHAINLHGLINRLGERPDHAATVNTALRDNTPPWFTPLGRRCFHVTPDGITAVGLL